MHKLDKNEEIFYFYQSSTRKFRISEKIDEERGTEVCKELELSREIDEKEQELIKPLTLALKFLLMARKSPGIEVCKHSFHKSVTPEIRKCKKTSEEVRNAVGTVSY